MLIFAKDGNRPVEPEAVKGQDVLDLQLIFPRRFVPASSAGQCPGAAFTLVPDTVADEAVPLCACLIQLLLSQYRRPGASEFHDLVFFGALIELPQVLDLEELWLYAAGTAVPEGHSHHVVFEYQGRNKGAFGHILVGTYGRKPFQSGVQKAHGVDRGGISHIMSLQIVLQHQKRGQFVSTDLQFFLLSRHQNAGIAAFPVIALGASHPVAVKGDHGIPGPVFGTQDGGPQEVLAVYISPVNVSLVSEPDIQLLQRFRPENPLRILHDHRICVDTVEQLFNLKVAVIV